MPCWTFARSSSSVTAWWFLAARFAREKSASAHTCRCTDLRSEAPLHAEQALNDCCASAPYEGLGTCLTPASFLRGQLHRLRRYVGHQTINDGYDRIRIGRYVRYETVNDGSEHFQGELRNERSRHRQDLERAVPGEGRYLAFGPIDARNEATEAPRIGAMIVEKLTRGLHSAVEWLSASLFPPSTGSGSDTAARPGTYPTRVSYRIPPQGICIC